jgi:Ca2+-binding RTX toxin-like protein
LTQDRVTTLVSGSAINSAVAMDADGNFVVVWETRSSPRDVYARIYSSVDGAIGEEFRINTTRSNLGSPPVVAMDSDGDFVVAWESQVQEGLGWDYGIYAQRFTSLGVAAGEEFRVNTNNTGNQTHTAIAMDTDGDFVVSWTSDGQDGSRGGIYAQRFNSAGVALGNEFRVNTTTTEDQRFSSVAMDADGDFVVVWAGPGRIYAQRYSAAGSALGSEFRVDTTIGAAQIDLGLPAVAMDADGNFVVTWLTYLSDVSGSGHGVFARRYNAAGVALGGEFRVDTRLSQFRADGPSVAMADNGEFVITWETWTPDGLRFAIYAQRYDVNGATIGGEFRVTTDTGTDQSYEAVAMDADGDFVITWQQVGGVYLNRFFAAPEKPSEAVLEYAARETAYGRGKNPSEYSDYVVADNFVLGSFSATLLVSPTQEAILAIRGTEFSSALDWYNNFRLTGVGQTELLQAWNQGKLQSWITANPGINVVGHSQAGTQAQLLAILASEANLNLGSVRTYNSPGLVGIQGDRLDSLNVRDVRHIISSGDVVAKAGADYIPGEVFYYDFDSMGLNPFGQIINAHTGHFSNPAAYSLANLPAAADLRELPDINVEELSAPEFSFLTAGNRFDPDYFILQLSVVGAGILVGEPQDGATIAKALSTREGVESLRSRISAAVELVVAALDAVVIGRAVQTAAETIETIYELGIDVAKLIAKWSVAAWIGFSDWAAETWEAFADASIAAWEALSEWTERQWNAAADWTEDEWQGLVSWAQDIWERSVNFGEETFDNLRSFGAGLLSTTYSNLVNALGNVSNGTTILTLVEKEPGLWEQLSAGRAMAVVQKASANATETIHLGLDPAIVVGAANDLLLQSAAPGSLMLTSSGQTTISITGGNNAVIGTMANLSGDVITGFTATDRIRVIDTVISPDQIGARFGSTVLDFDLDRNGTTDATITLEGDAIGLMQLETSASGGTALSFSGRASNAVYTGSDAADIIIGGAERETLQGQAGNDRLFGGDEADQLEGGNGADTLVGGPGDDIFFVTDTGDLVIEAASGGSDTIIASLSMTSQDQVEVLHIAEGVSGITVTGSAGNDMLIGNGLANSFNGGAGDDVILVGNVTLADIHALFAI